VSADSAASPAAFATGTIARAHAALGRLEPGARAFWLYDLDALEARARRLARAFAPLAAVHAYALKANALPALIARVHATGLAAEAGSLGELALAHAAGFPAAKRVLNGNGRTREEATWVADHGVHSVNADHVGELDLLEAVAARAGARVRVALRVNPGIETPVHRYVATGDDEAKFGIAPHEALEAWAGRARWPHLVVDGVHLHVGSQLLDFAPLERATGRALELAHAAAERGAPLSLVNLGGGFGVDYAGEGREFPLETWAARLTGLASDSPFEWVLEPGRWLVAPVGVLVAEVLWVKLRRDAAGRTRRFVVLAAGMNDLIRPALYGARHRIEPLRPRGGGAEPATIVGPVCESADVFALDADLPPVEAGDLVVVRDAGAYGAAMSSNYNGRGRLAEITWSAGRLTRARAGETPADLAARARDDRLD
jgi:diaminopimelate decarboxylase